jgi:ubiquinone/menaquinone biosynthesis C-methylase UbiE
MDEVKTKATDAIRRRYNRIAFLYDLMEWPMERRRFAGWRSRLRSKISGPRALEVGVGTGKNIPYYPPRVSVTAIDFSPRMLSRARMAARRCNGQIDIRVMDVQHLDLPTHAFDTVFATFVFCSVPDPVQGLAELRRVCKPAGRLLLLEHMRPGSFWLGLLFDALNPLTVRMTGANINRRTIENVKQAGWQIQVAQRLSLDIVWWIEAVPKHDDSPDPENR